MAKSNDKKSNWSAPHPDSGRYAPPAPDKLKGAATHQDNARAVELLKSDKRQVYVNGPK